AIVRAVPGGMQAPVWLVRLAGYGHFRLDQSARGNLPRIAAATLIMALILVGLRLLLASALAGPALLRLGALAGLIAAGLLSFGALILAFGVTDWRELRGRLRRQPA